MDAVTVIALTAIVLSALTFIATQFGSKRTATADYVSQLEHRVETLEKELNLQRLRNIELEAENLRLMRKILENGKNG